MKVRRLELLVEAVGQAAGQASLPHLALAERERRLERPQSCTQVPSHLSQTLPHNSLSPVSQTHTHTHTPLHTAL